MVHSKSQPLKSTIKHRGPLKVGIGTRQLTGARMYLFAAGMGRAEPRVALVAALNLAI